MDEIDKLAWIYIKNNQLLLARSKGKANFFVPGGKRETGETDQAALIREIKEELSVDLRSETIQYIETFKAQADGKPKGVWVKIICYSAEFSSEIKASAEIEEIAWLSLADKDKCSMVTKIIMDWLQLKGMLS